MFGRTWRVGRIAGVDIRIDVSWTLIFVLVTYSLLLRLGDIYPGLSIGLALTLAVTASILFFGSVLTHEMAHAITARRRGIPVHGITLFLFGGATHAAVDARGPGAEFVVAGVGPLTSLALAGLFGLGGAFGEGILPEEVAGTLGYLGWVNLMLALFNLLPGFPLDGGRVLRSVVWKATGSLDRATRVAAIAGQTLGYLLVAAGAVVAATGLLSNGVWLVAIGLFLAQAARSSDEQQRMQSLLRRAVASEVMSPANGIPDGSEMAVAPGASMAEVVEMLDAHRRQVGRADGHVRIVVVEQGEILGVITPADFARWLGEQLPTGERR